MPIIDEQVWQAEVLKNANKPTKILIDVARRVMSNLDIEPSDDIHARASITSAEHAADVTLSRAEKECVARIVSRHHTKGETFWCTWQYKCWTREARLRQFYHQQQTRDCDVLRYDPVKEDARAGKTEEGTPQTRRKTQRKTAKEIREAMSEDEIRALDEGQLLATRQIWCPRCNGTGTYQDETPLGIVHKMCPTCLGSGIAAQSVPLRDALVELLTGKEPGEEPKEADR